MSEALPRPRPGAGPPKAPDTKDGCLPFSSSPLLPQALS